MNDEAKYIAILCRKYGDVMDDECIEALLDTDDIEGVAAAIASLGAPFNAVEAQILSMVDSNEDFGSYGDVWKDDILNKYAEHIYNYHYNYNNEALKVDPNIDLEKEHIGPMAQDLEKVNPATVVEDPNSGYKTVDTSRLALMNAGAIAALVRELAEVKEAVGV